MRKCLIVALAALFGTADSRPDGPIIRQQGRIFSEASVVVHRGEIITFFNDDTVPHNVMSESADNAFDVGSQLPGSARTVSFDAIGTVVVICAIHPRMRMVVTVVQ